MAFLDKLNSLAKNVGDKTKEAMEVSKLNAKIRTEKASIEAAYKKLGVHFYERHTAGDIYDEAAEEIFAAIDASNSTISELEAEIEKIKAEKEAAKTAAATQVQAQAPAQSMPSGVPCPACGKLNAPGAKFCGNCGAKIEDLKINEQQDTVEQEEPDKIVCPSCGIELAGNAKFCGNCGTKIEDLKINEQQETVEPEEPGAPEEPEEPEEPQASEEPEEHEEPEEPQTPEKPEAPEEPVKKVCPSCGVELVGNAKFCGNCGTKIE